MKLMKTNKMQLLFFVISVVISGCASFPEANGENQTLVIGGIEQHGEGYALNGTISVNGTNKTGIDIILQELDGENTYTMRTNSDGIFYSVDIPEGSYKITRFYFRKSSGVAWTSLSWNTPLTEERRIEIVRGRVNNMGTFQWRAKSGESNVMTFNSGYDEVKGLFQERNKKSNWNEKEWTNVRVNRVVLTDQS